jgi:hypothetical protein
VLDLQVRPIALADLDEIRPAVGQLRDDQRFADLVKKMGLLE